MSEVPEPSPPAVCEEQVQSVLQQPSPSSSRMQQEPLPLLEAGDVGSPDSASSSAEVVDIMSEVMQPPSLSSTRMQQEPPPPLLQAGEEGSADTLPSSVQTENMSFSESAARLRPWSPQPSTSSPKMQIPLQPFVKAGAQNFRSSNGATRPWSPQPSTSSAGMMTERELQPFYAPDGVTGDHMYAQDLSMRRDSVGSPETRASSPQPSTSAGMLFEMANDAKSANTTAANLSIITQSISDAWRRIRPWSPTPSTSSAATMLECELTPVNTEGGGADGTSKDSLYIPDNISIPGSKRLRPWSKSNLRPTMTAEATSSDSDSQKTSASPSPRIKLRRWPAQQLTTPAQRASQDMQSLTEAGGATSADSNLPSFSQNVSNPAGERKKRPWSEQPSTTTVVPPAALPLTMPDHDLLAAIDSEAKAFAWSVVQSISAMVRETNMLAQSSPQPATSSAPPPMQSAEAVDEEADAGSSNAAPNISIPVGEGEAPPAPEPSTSTAATMDVEQPPVTEPAPANPADSVYSHVPHDISNIPQLTGLKAGRRHGRLRRLYIQKKINEKYGPMIPYFGPMVAEQSTKQQTQRILIASALDHFANIINQIVDKYEGTIDTTGFMEQLEEFIKRVEERREKRRLCDPNAPEEPLPPPPYPPQLPDEEINRRLREETEAAVEALLTGDKSRDRPPDRFAEIIKSFQDAYDPK